MSQYTDREVIIKKETGLALGLAFTLVTTILAGAFWVKDSISDNTIQLLLIKQKLVSIEYSVDTRFDNLKAYIDTHIKEVDKTLGDRYTATDQKTFVKLLKAKNPTMEFDD